MPCLTDNGEVYTESEEIVKYLEYFYPSPTLSLETPEIVEEVRDDRWVVVPFSRGPGGALLCSLLSVVIAW